MPRTRTLSSLLAELPDAALLRGSPETAVAGVDHDSRRVEPGWLFVAIHGLHVDGHQFLPEAAERGSAAVLVQRGRDARLEGVPAEVAIIEVQDSRSALSAAAAWFWDHPARSMTVVGVTGTDGKTTTAHLMTEVLGASGARVGRMGTVDVLFPGHEGGFVGGRMTTPEATEVQRVLRLMADAGTEIAILESTSHGLALNRLDHADYDVAVLTNVTGDHLDFHETFEAYRDAKARLFDAVAAKSTDGPAAAVVNADDPSASFMLKRAGGANPLRYGLESTESDVAARAVTLRPDGSSFRLVTPMGEVDAEVRLPAIFNVYNALAAASAGVALGMTPGDLATGLARCRGVSGRMERIDAGQPFQVVVDYAHTGDAVRKVLEVLRVICSGRLILVVGAAGERDPGRRFGVGRAAADGADFAVFTSEDPRTEDPLEIVREIGRHAADAGRRRGEDFVEVEDRREAIRTALEMASSDDIVVIAGKGHEQSMIYGFESRPWDDRQVAREELERLGYASRPLP